MPDISMCNADHCPRKTECYRHEASGTKPNDGRQSYMMFQPGGYMGGCYGFMPVATKTEAVD